RLLLRNWAVRCALRKRAFSFAANRWSSTMSSNNPTLSSRFVFRRRLGTGLLIFFVLLAVVPATILTVYSKIQEEQRQEQSAQNLVAVHADAAATALKDWASAQSGAISFDLTHPDYQPLMAQLVTDPNAAKNADLQSQFIEHTHDVVNSRNFQVIV